MKSIFVFVFSMIIAGCSSSEENSNNEQRKTTVENCLYQTVRYLNTEVTLKGSSSLVLIGKPNEILENSQVNIMSDDAWLFLPTVSLKKWNDEGFFDKIKIKSKPIVCGKNADLFTYYNGLLVKPIVQEKYEPISLYKNNDTVAYSVELGKVCKGSEIPCGDNNLSKFILKRGHMVVLAENEDGTGASKVYVALKNNLEVSLDSDLKNRVSFIRVMPWNYVSKKGISDYKETFKHHAEFGVSWFYSWRNKGTSTHQLSFTPMIWGLASQKAIDIALSDNRANHILAYNEPDKHEQSNISVEDALKNLPLLYQLGLRVGSPVCSEDQWNKWLFKFMNGCKERGYRIDFVAIHWYDWGNWCAQHEKSPQNIDAMVNRFKNYIDKCYQTYGLPIWITEFNANINRTSDVQKRFLEKALPMLEAHPHVERYAYYRPDSGTGKFYENDKITEVGIAYGEVLSQPAFKNCKQ